MGIRAWDRIFKPFGIKDPFESWAGRGLYFSQGKCMFVHTQHRPRVSDFINWD